MYSSRSAAAADHSGRPDASPSFASLPSGVSEPPNKPRSRERERRSRTWVRNSRIDRTLMSMSSGHPRSIPLSWWPSRMSLRMASCSPPESRRGGNPSPLASETMVNARDEIDLASGPAVVMPARSAKESRMAVADWRDGVTTRAAAWPRDSRMPATSSRITVDFPVPGAPKTR